MIRRLLALLRRRRQPEPVAEPVLLPPPEPSGDWCSTCLVDLDRGEVWEAHSGHEAFRGEDGALHPGGTYLVQTYCGEHAPKGAVRT